MLRVPEEVGRQEDDGSTQPGNHREHRRVSPVGRLHRALLVITHRYLIYQDRAGFTWSSNKRVSFYKVHTNWSYAVSYISVADK